MIPVDANPITQGLDIMDEKTTCKKKPVEAQLDRLHGAVSEITEKARDLAGSLSWVSSAPTPTTEEKDATPESPCELGSQLLAETRRIQDATAILVDLEERLEV